MFQFRLKIENRTTSHGRLLLCRGTSFAHSCSILVKSRDNKLAKELLAIAGKLEHLKMKLREPHYRRSQQWPSIAAALSTVLLSNIMFTSMTFLFPLPPEQVTDQLVEARSHMLEGLNVFFSISGQPLEPDAFLTSLVCRSRRDRNSHRVESPRKCQGAEAFAQGSQARSKLTIQQAAGLFFAHPWPSAGRVRKVRDM